MIEYAIFLAMLFVVIGLLIWAALKFSRDASMYSFAYGKIMALARVSTKKDTLENMIVSKNVDEAAKHLDGTEYAPYCSKAETVEEYELALSEVLSEDLKTIEGYLPEKWVMGIFKARVDLRNLKMLFRARHRGKLPEEPVFSSRGTVEMEVLLKLVDKSESIKKLGSDFAKLFEKAEKAFEETKCFQCADFIFDRALFKKMLDTVPHEKRKERRRYRRVHELFQMYIDVVNIQTLFKMKIDEFDVDTFAKAILPGGKELTETFLKKTYVLGINDIVKEFRITSYGDVVQAGIEEYKKTQTLTGLENEADNYRYDRLKKAAALNQFSPEFVIHYLFWRELEVRNLQAVIKCKAAGIEPAMIRTLICNVTM